MVEYMREPISPGNNTETALADGAEFTGAWEISPHPSFLIMVRADTTCTVYLEFSADGTNVDSTLTLDVAANIPDVHKYELGNRSFRVRIVNDSGTAQTYLRCHVTYGSFSQLTAPRNLVVGADADTAMTRTTDYSLDQAQGLYAGEELHREVGFHSSVGTTQQLISNLEVAFASYDGFLTAATTVRVKAGGNAADDAAGNNARTIEVEGLDANWERQTATITLAGASASSATTETWIRVDHLEVLTVGTYGAVNAGDIVVETSDGTKDLCKISAGHTISENCVETIPAGVDGYLEALSITVEGAKEVAIEIWKRENADDITAPMTPAILLERYNGLTGDVQHAFRQYHVLPPKTDVWAVATGPSGGAAVTLAMEIDRVNR